MSKRVSKLYSRISTPALKPNCEECAMYHCNPLCENRKSSKGIKMTKEEIDNRMTENQLYQLLHEY